MLKNSTAFPGILLVLVLASCVSGAARSQGDGVNGSVSGTAGLPEGLTDNDGFLRFRGKVIHPGAFRDLSIWISDTEPTVTAVDLEGCQDTERYSLAEPKIKKKAVCLYDEKQKVFSNRPPFFAYEYIGVLSDNVHVVKTAECGDGTGIFMSLLLVRFASEQAYHWDKYRSRTVMKCVGEIGLGDRYYGKITLEENGIRIGPYVGLTEVLSYPKERFFDLKQAVR